MASAFIYLFIYETELLSVTSITLHHTSTCEWVIPEACSSLWVSTVGLFIPVKASAGGGVQVQLGQTNTDVADPDGDISY